MPPRRGASGVALETLDGQQHVATGVELIEQALQGRLVGNLGEKVGERPTGIGLIHQNFQAPEPVRPLWAETAGDPDPVAARIEDRGEWDSFHWVLTHVQAPFEADLA